MLLFRDGDEEAFGQLVRRNIRKVHALAYRFLGDNTQAEDIAQEAFLRVYLTAQRYKPAAKFGTWLYRIVANLCFNALRSRRRGRFLWTQRPEDDQVLRRDVPETRSQPPGDALGDEELKVKVTEAIEKLPENQKLAIILSKYEEKSYDQIAAVLDCSIMAVKSLLSRARENLRNSLRQYLRHGR